jgi:hypothetical protein
MTAGVISAPGAAASAPDMGVAPSPEPEPEPEAEPEPELPLSLPPPLDGPSRDPHPPTPMLAHTTAQSNHVRRYVRAI